MTGWALVTGASSGLGAEFARQLAAAGHDLVLVARDTDRLDALAVELADRHGVAIEVLEADLVSEAGRARTCARLVDTDEPIDLLVNNAGVGVYVPFKRSDWADEQRQLELNVVALARLTHAAAPAMIARGRGRILNVSSVAGFVPRVNNASYAASKSYVTLLSEALALQLTGTGVTVTAVCPGFVRTEFHQRAHADMSHVDEKMWGRADEVVREALAATFAGTPVFVPTRRYRVLATAGRLAPRRLLRRAMLRNQL